MDGHKLQLQVQFIVNFISVILMITHFVLDLDGCLTFPFQPPHWQAITAIRALQQRSEAEEHVPALSLCTGRPLPYAEAVAQWLGIRHTIIFESGGGFYHPLENRLGWSPNYTDELAAQSALIREWFMREIEPDYPGVVVEFAKRTDVGVVHNNKNDISRIYEQAQRKIESDFPDFEVHQTGISVNIIAAACNKATGLEHFCELEQTQPSQLGYIGDSSGDLKALRLAGIGFAPANAIDEVKSVARVMQGEATLGVLQAYEQLVVSNASTG